MTTESNPASTAGEEGTGSGPVVPDPAGTGTGAAPLDGDPNAVQASGQKPEDLPDWARRQLEQVRGEAATYRTRLREKEAELASKIEAETAAREKAEREVLREQVARRFALPDDLAALLQGDGADQLEQHAKTLAKYAPQASFDAAAARGGLDPADEGDDDLDPVALAARVRAGRY